MARQEAEQRQDAAAAITAASTAAAAAVQQQEQEDAGRAQQVAALPSFYTEDTPATANEMWQRLHSDPLFAIKQQELQARKAIVANPVKMHAIQQQVRFEARVSFCWGEGREC